MISYEKKFIFIAVPRTGTGSFRTALGLGGDWHRRVSDYCRVIGEQKISSFFKFAIVRNPWDRVVSIFHYHFTHERDYGYRDYKKQLTFSNFVRQINFNENLPKRIMDPSGKFEIPQFMTFTQSCWIDRKIDFIGRFENLQQDFNIICDKIGIPKQKLPLKHKTNHKHYTEYYDDETRSIVAEKYAKDIEYFGYKFGD